MAKEYKESKCPSTKKRIFEIWYIGIMGFPGGSDSKESACNVGNLGSIPGSRRSPGEGNSNPLQYSLPGESHGQRSLADTTEQLTL